MEYKPASPIIVYTVLEMMDMVPKNVATKSRLKRPTSPQLIAPTIIKIRETISNQLRSK